MGGEAEALGRAEATQRQAGKARLQTREIFTSAEEGSQAREDGNIMGSCVFLRISWRKNSEEVVGPGRGAEKQQEPGRLQGRDLGDAAEE